MWQEVSKIMWLFFLVLTVSPHGSRLSSSDCDAIIVMIKNKRNNNNCANGFDYYE